MNLHNNEPIVMIRGIDTILVGVHVGTLESYDIGPLLCGEHLHPNWGWASVGIRKNGSDFTTPLPIRRHSSWTRFGRNLKYRFRSCKLKDSNKLQKEVDDLMKPEFDGAFDGNPPFVMVAGNNTLLVAVHCDTLASYVRGPVLCDEYLSPKWGSRSIQLQTNPLNFSVICYDKTNFGKFMPYRFRICNLSCKDRIQKEVDDLMKPEFEKTFDSNSPFVTIIGHNTILVGVHVDTLLAHSGGQKKLCRELISPTWGWESIEAKTDPLDFAVLYDPDEQKDIFGRHLRYRFRVRSITDKEKIQKEIKEMKNAVHNFYELIDTDKRAMILIGPENSIVLIRNDVLVGSTGDHYVMGHTISPSWGEDVIEYNKNPLKFVITEADFSTTLSEFRAKISSNFHLKKVKDQIDALLSENMQTHYWD